MRVTTNVIVREGAKRGSIETMPCPVAASVACGEEGKSNAPERRLNAKSVARARGNSSAWITDYLYTLGGSQAKTLSL